MELLDYLIKCLVVRGLQHTHYRYFGEKSGKSTTTFPLKMTMFKPFLKAWPSASFKNRFRYINTILPIPRNHFDYPDRY